MKINLNSLGLFSRLAQTGAKQASASLSLMTGIDTRVDVTKVSLLSRDDIAAELASQSLFGVQIGLSGVLSGETWLTFDSQSFDALVEDLAPEASPTDEMTISSINEVGNIVISGFIDGWANHFEAGIDITPPTYLDDAVPALTSRLERTLDEMDFVFLFTNEIVASDRAVNFSIYMLPERETLEYVFSREADPTNGLMCGSKLRLFQQLIKQGAATASESITMMSGITTSVEVSRLTFLPLEVAPAGLSDTPQMGVVHEFQGSLNGYLLILFDEPSAHKIASALLPGVTGPDFESMRQSAIQEIGNIVTSGFIDGWANTLGTTIDHTPPQYVHDLGSAIMDPIVVELATSEEFALLIDSVLQTETGEFSCNIFLLPRLSDFQGALDEFDARAVQP